MPHQIRATSRRVNFAIDEETWQLLAAYASKHFPPTGNGTHPNLSEAARHLLRSAIGTTIPPDMAGYKAGYMEGYHTFNAALKKAMAEVAAREQQKLEEQPW